MPANENGGEDIALVLKAKIDSSMNTAVNLLDMAGDKVMELSASMDQSAGVANNFMKQLGGVGEQLKHIEKSDIGKKIVILAGAFSLATTAAFKFGQSVFKSETELRKMAKTQRKSVEATRASNVALETMGKTLREVKADKELKSIYNELVKVNSEIAMPNAERGISAVKELRNTFWKLHGIAKYAIQSIGIRILNQLEEPIKRITDKLGGVAKWLQNNFDSVTMKISSGITAFLKGIDGIARGVTSVIEKISKINPAIRQIGTAILAVFALIKSGPLGAIISAITMIGAIIDDAENYKYNKRYGLTEQNREAIDEKGHKVQYVETAMTGVWDLMFGDGTSKQKTQSIFDLVLDTAIEKLGQLTDMLKKFDLYTLLMGETNDAGQQIGGWFNTIIDILKKPETQKKIAELGSAIIAALTEAFKTGADIAGDAAALIVSLFGGGEGSPLNQKLQDLLANGSFSSAIGGGLMMKLLGFDQPWQIIGGGLLTGYQEARDKAIEELGKEASEDQILGKVFENLNLEVGNIADVLSGLLTKAAHMLGTGGKIIGGTTSSILGEILKAVFKVDPDDKEKLTGQILGDLQESITWSSITEGIAASLVSGNGTVGLIAGIGSAIDRLFLNPESEDALQKEFDRIKNIFETIWLGAAGKDGKRKDNGLRSVLAPIFQDAKTGIASFFDGIWNGEDGNGGLHKTLTDLWDKVNEAVDKWWNGDYVDDRGMGTPSNRKKTGGFKDVLKNLFTGEESILDPVVKFFSDLFAKLAEKAGEWGSSIWQAFFNSMPEWIRDAITGLGGFENPNGPKAIVDSEGNPVIDENGKPAYEGGSKIEYDENGNSYIVTSSGKRKQISQRFVEDDQLSKIIPFIDFGNNGRVKLTGKLTGAENASGFGSELSQILGSLLKGEQNENSFNSDRKAVISILNGFLKDRKKNKNNEDEEGVTVPIDADTEEYNDKLDEAVKQGNNAKVEPKLTLDTKAAKLAIDVVAAYAQKQMKIPFGFGKYSPGAYGSQGGRFNDPTNMQIGEDGPEYLIPISKPTRAMNLIRQMLGEMGASTANKLLADFGMNLGADHIGGNYSAMTALPNGGATVTNNNNVSAPVNIYVTASGVSAEDVGERAYDAAQRQMLRTLKGVFA